LKKRPALRYSTGMRHPARLLLACAALLLAAATIAPEAPPQPLSRAEAYRRAAALAALGKQMFSDPRLSASGQMSCASCHDPKAAFSPGNDAAVQLGGADMRQPGIRAVPSLRYLQAVPQFTEHYFENDDEGDESVDNGPTGGLTWDGRVDAGRDQARIPLLSTFEMANHDAAAVARRVRDAGYMPDLQRIFDAAALEGNEAILEATAKAFEVYEQDWREFYPYSSKYDRYLAGKATLTPQEARGLALFEDPDKGNCAQCHISKQGNDGTPPQFTDYGMIALAVPRNPAIPANADPNYYDLGLCGPVRTDLKDHPDYCGLFLTPTLRNVALRHAFFHNGFVHSLRDAVAFYVERETRPEKWYPRNADGSVRKYDDLPQRYWDNINTDPPFDRSAADKPALDDAEIDDVVAFLKTLTDEPPGERAASR
jgi:cytochrome c peroxidase